MTLRPLVPALVCLLAVPSGASTINVKSRGARGNGQADDTAAVNRAIAHSAPGDTIFFPAGTYKIAAGTGITLEPDRTYTGDAHGQSILLGTGGYSVASSRYNLAVGITLANLVFDGGGLRLDGKEVPARGVSVTGCTFRNIVTDGENWTSHMGIFLPAGAEQSHFDRNRFSNIFTGGKHGFEDADATGIFGYGLSHTTIADNTFDMVNEGVHIFFDHTDGAEVLVARNHFTHVHRMTLEFQHHQTVSLTVRDNTVSDPLDPYWLTYGMSIVPDGTGVVVEGNTIVANTPLDFSRAPKNYYPFGLEIAGGNTVASRNRIIGLWGTGIGIGTASGMHLKNNLICGKVASTSRSIEEYLGPQPGTVRDGNIVTLTCPADAQALLRPSSP